MNDVIEIALSQLVLWYDSTRIQTWPSLLAKVDPLAVLPSPTSLGCAHVTDRMTDNRHAAAEKITRNLPGLEQKGRRLVLRGIGLLEHSDGGYRLSESGRELAQLYRDDPQGLGWVRLLGRLLLTREPRTRTLIGLLSQEDAVLCFTTAEWWGGRLQQAIISLSGTRQFAPFAKTDSPVPNLRSAMNERAWWACGEWRSHPLLEGVTDCRFVGQLKPDFSLHDIGLALRASCEVLVQLNVLSFRGKECRLDHDAAIKQFGAELASDFGWQGTSKSRPLWQTIAELLPALRMDTGYVVVSDLREQLRKQGIENPDREIARLEAEGRLIIEATDYGQIRHGIGLYEDPGKQLIKLRVG